MNTKILSALLAAALAWPVAAASVDEITRYQDEFSTARLVAVRVNDAPAIAVKFSGTSDLHFYADPATAPAPDLDLRAVPQTPDLRFSDTLYPKPDLFYDASYKKDIEVYVGDFYLVLPITSYPLDLQRLTVAVKLSGIACTSKLCLPPFEKILTADIDFSDPAAWPVLDFTPAPRPTLRPSEISAVASQPLSMYEVTAMLLLALAAGLAFNIMPCVLPVLPLVVSRMVNIAKEHPARRIALGLTFCLGIVAFFALIGAFSAAVRLTTGSVFNLSDPYRYPVFDIIMALFLVVFALFMFDILPLTLPSSISGKSANASTFSGSLGMGFLAAILSIPCSGAILAAVLIWVQAQHWLMGFWAFLLMGIGMALPYAALVLAPGLLSRIPKPGPWMDYFKKAMGFAMLLLALKPLSALPKDRILDVAAYAVILAFAVWMWGTWVSFSTPTPKKWLIRGLALLVAVVSGFLMLPQKTDLIPWQDYDRTLIQAAVAENRPVLIKFTADWCTNCKILESRVFRDPDVAASFVLKNVLAIKADTTLAGFPASVDLQQVYGIPGTVPMTILHLPGRPDPIHLSGIYDKQELFEALQPLD
jgi:thiol:disulfide interchange protein DsbD